MIYATDKFEFFEKIKHILSEHDFLITPAKEIQHGLQFQIEYQSKFGTIRIYENKKGINLDLSQVKETALAKKISDLIIASDVFPDKITPLTPPEKKQAKTPSILKALTEDPNELIGVDESGKGDYFGPLVIAGVHITLTTKNKLEHLGVRDSKTIKSDTKIITLANQIKELCPHSLVILSNKSYNEIYEKMKNLNHILAWGHARVIESILGQTPCQYALCDQFGNASLINSALINKGKNITLFQRPHAESNTAVAAASILAREAFITNLKKMSDYFNIELPRGASDEVIEVANKLISKYGKDTLDYVAKRHFKITDQLNDRKKT